MNRVYKCCVEQCGRTELQVIAGILECHLPNYPVPILVGGGTRNWGSWKKRIYVNLMLHDYLLVCDVCRGVAPNVEAAPVHDHMKQVLVCDSLSHTSW